MPGMAGLSRQVVSHGSGLSRQVSLYLQYGNTVYSFTVKVEMFAWNFQLFFRQLSFNSLKSREVPL